MIWTPGPVPIPELFPTPLPPADCRLAAADLPAGWIEHFPTGEQIIRKTIELRALAGTNVDLRLLRRRECEYELFQSVENAVYLPTIREGASSSVEQFVSLAQTILQSRKSRSGNSLELHVRETMIEEGLHADRDFTHRPVIEGGKRPDFIFPSKTAYENASFPQARLRMLAAKTTCKDRWRQVLNEASRVPYETSFNPSGRCVRRTVS